MSQQNYGDQTSYKETLNLPQTSFSMRANAAQRELKLQELWRERNIDLQLGLENLNNALSGWGGCIV